MSQNDLSDKLSNIFHWKVTIIALQQIRILVYSRKLYLTILALALPPILQLIYLPALPTDSSADIVETFETFMGKYCFRADAT